MCQIVDRIEAVCHWGVLALRTSLPVSMPGFVLLLRLLGLTLGSHLKVAALLVLRLIDFEIVLYPFGVSNAGNFVKVCMIPYQD
jgi:hypothetical protein